MWQIESSREVAAPSEAVWRRYTEPATWPEWAHNTVAASFPRGVVQGSEGVVTPATGRTQRVRIVKLRAGRLLVGEIRLPGAAMRFRYEIEPAASGVRIRHQIRMAGPLSTLYGWLIRRRNERQLAEETGRLARLVEGEAAP